MMNEYPILYTDGLAKGNPGPAATAFVYCDAGGNELTAIAQSIGEATNNVAEYRALIAGLEHALIYTRSILIRMDSELIVRQIQGKNQVKALHLVRYYAQTQVLLSQFDHWTITWIPRKDNARADRIANLAAAHNRPVVWKCGVLQPPL